MVLPTQADSELSFTYENFTFWKISFKKMAKLDFSPQILLDDSCSLPDHELKPFFDLTTQLWLKTTWKSWIQTPYFCTLWLHYASFVQACVLEVLLFKVIPSLVSLFHKVQL